MKIAERVIPNGGLTEQSGAQIEFPRGRLEPKIPACMQNSEAKQKKEK